MLRYGLGALTLTSIAHAQTASRCTTGQPEGTARDALIRFAVDCSAAGDHSAAVTLAQRAGAINMTPSLRMMIAEEQEQAGDLAAALTTARECERLATPPPPGSETAGTMDEILVRCHSDASRLAARVGRVVLRVPGPLPVGLSVRVAGLGVLAVHDGTSVIVAPGVVPVEAEIPDGRVLQLTVTVPAGGEVDAVLTLAIGRSHASDRAPVSRGIGAGPWVTMAAGAVVFAASLPLGLARGAAFANCPEQIDPGRRGCDTQGDVDALYGWNAAMTATLITGGAVMAGGVVWLIAEAVHRGSSAPRATASVSPLAGGAWVGFGERF